MVIKLERKDFLQCTDLTGLFAVGGMLLGAFYFQIVLGELPCALCNLIRAALLVFGAGLFLNIRFVTNPWNYILSGALIGSLISLLFLFVKAPPGTPPTGSAILGLHMYSWTFIFFTGAIAYCMLALALTSNGSGEQSRNESAGRLRRLAIALFFVVGVANLLSAFLQNGFAPFKASNQQHYQMLYDGDVMKP
ncbi:disulfide bond formation protein B [Pseudomonas sp. Fig-3]|uniref:disulfide bond formation protein B n=1 Tax=unclassified Pseudomonas TaxID=196821 RepID=UPI0011129117|nr:MULTISPECIES: disulfide bond formation protein B [unclassified Pseudomonas]TNB81531.1 disulfide bond formation protein B [Pseudomonas sp. Fig-3]